MGNIVQLGTQEVPQYPRTLSKAVYTAPNKTLDSALEIANREYGSMTPIIVKKDGTGDFTTIQEAINSITDASYLNQYDIQVYDDYIITDLKDLWLTYNSASTTPTRNTLDTPTVSVALVITKDWVNIRGVGARKRLYIESPNLNMSGSAFQVIQVIYPKGNCIISNFSVEIKGGRYAIHQEAGGRATSLDYHSTIVYKNLYVRHYGNSTYTNGSSWPYTSAQADGTTSGSRKIYINCEWVSDEYRIPFYVHSNNSFDLPNTIVYYGCRAVSLLEDSSDIECNFSDRNSYQANNIEIVGCDFKSYKGLLQESAGITDGTGAPTVALEKNIIFNNIYGFGNTRTIVPMQYVMSLAITAKNNGDSVSVIGGSASELIFGRPLLTVSGCSGFKGVTGGSIRLVTGNYSRVHDMAYILGNCASDNKTLIVRVTHSDNTYNDYTIVFDQNYMTSDGSAYSYNTTPNISMESIINSINTQFGDYFTCGTMWAMLFSPFIDTKELGVNRTSENIGMGCGVVRDYEHGINCWKKAGNGEIAEGIACLPISPNEQGEILIVSKCLFRREVISVYSNMTSGWMYKCNGSGGWARTDNVNEATLISFGKYALAPINHN